MKKTVLTTISATALLFLGMTVVHAQNAGATVTTSTAGTNTSATVSVKTKNSATRLANLISRGDTEITARITALNNLNTRIGNMKNVSAAEKASIGNAITADINGLTSLKAKLDAETDLTAAQADVKSITGSFRIYALVVPQGYIESSADRIATVSASLKELSAKLQTRITAAQTAGKDVSAMQTALNDLNAKVSDASTQGLNAQAGVSGLTPDNGNSATAQANTAALKAARANIKTAEQDFQAARQDAKTIVNDLKALDIKANTSVNSNSQANQNQNKQ